MVKGSKDKYAQKVEGGNKRKLMIMRYGIYKKSEEIAQILGCSKSTVDHSDGWKKRAEMEFFAF